MWVCRYQYQTDGPSHIRMYKYMYKMRLYVYAAPMEMNGDHGLSTPKHVINACLLTGMANVT